MGEVKVDLGEEVVDLGDGRHFWRSRGGFGKDGDLCGITRFGFWRSGSHFGRSRGGFGRCG